MSKRNLRKSKSVTRKAADKGALRFLKVRQSDKNWLLAHTAIVVGAIGLGMIGAPSLALAAPGCANNGDNLDGRQQFNCNGFTINPPTPSGMGTIVVAPDHEYDMFVDGTGGGSTPFQAYVNNGAVIHVDTDSEDIDGTILINNGAILDNIDGDGFWLESAGYTDVTNNGRIVGGSEEGSVGFRADGGGDLDFINYGHVEGYRAGVFVEDGGDTYLANHSYHSVMGGNGFEVVNTNGKVEVDNSEGLTAGLNGDGVHIYDVDDTSITPAVEVNNYNSGIIVGNEDGIFIEDVYGNNGGVVVDNAAYFEMNGNYVDGGFVAGVYGNGVSIYDVEDGVTIYNGGTRAQGINFGTIAEDGIDPRVYLVGDGDSLLLQDGSLFGAYEDGGIVPSRGIWGNYDGIEVAGVGNVEIYNTTEDYGGEDYLGGLIVGRLGDGIDIYNANSADIWNQNGLIWGGEDGISIQQTGRARVENGGGTIIGASGAGISVLPGMWSETEDLSEDVEIYNASMDGPEDGGLIVGNEQGILVVSQRVFVGNGADGAILGYGFGSDDAYYGQAVVELYTEGDLGYGRAGVYNYGLISSVIGEEGSEDAPHVDWYGPLDFASTGSAEDEDVGIDIDLDAINSDIMTFAQFAWSGGGDGALYNDETGTALADYGNIATGLAISSMGAYTGNIPNEYDIDGVRPGASAEVGNGPGGTIIGRIALVGDTYWEDGEDDGYYGSAINNLGTWYVKDYGSDGLFQEMSEDFSPAGLVITAYGDAEINNAGLIQSAFNSEEYETATFYISSFDTEEPDGWFSNGWSRQSIFDGPSELAWDQQWGLLSLVDGGVGDAFLFASNFYGSDFTEDGYSLLAMDVNFAPDEMAPRSDFFIITGEAGGHTGVIVHNLNPGSTEMVGDEIQIGESGRDYTEDGAFYLAQQQPGYTVVDGVGAIQDGLYAWYMDTRWSNEEGEDGAGYYLVSTFGPQAVQMPTLITAAQGVWYDTASVVSDHVYGQHFPVAGGGGAGADLPVGMAPQQVASAPETAVWGKISGSWTQQDTSVVQDVPPAPVLTIDTSFVQNTFSLLGGADFQPMGAGGPIRLGVFGGYIASTVDFDSYGGSADLSGGTIGAYAAYTNGGFYLDAQGKVDLLNLSYSAPLVGDTDAAVTSYGIEANTGYRMDMGNMFFEPSATLAYVNTNIDDLSVGTASVGFSSGNSLRGGVGVTVGTTLDTGNDTTTELAVLAKVWNEFEDANTVTLSDGLGGTVEFNDNISGVFGEVRGTATITSADQSLSGFASAGAKFNENFTTVDAKLGVRKGF